MGEDAGDDDDDGADVDDAEGVDVCMMVSRRLTEGKGWEERAGGGVVARCAVFCLGGFHCRRHTLAHNDMRLLCCPAYCVHFQT